MAQIYVSNLIFGYEGSFDNIFEDVSFSIDTNWKLGFIGRNGKGKTTFLRLLQGKYEYQGSITTSTVFDYFPYQVSEQQKKDCFVDIMEQLRPGCQLWKVLCELEELGVGAEALYRPFETLSHGERTKVMLALLFSEENYFLLIDEPTNHLDQKAREIVKRYLSSKKGFILVSHDRDLLDATVDHVLVLNRATIEVQSGNFSTWWENKERADHFHQAENEKHRKEIGKLREAAKRTKNWADKNERTKIGFDPIAEHDRCLDTRAIIGAKTKKLQSRVKQMEERIEAQIQQKEGLLQDIEKPVELKLMPKEHHKRVLISAVKYGLSYPGDTPKEILQEFDFELQQGERVCLQGENGCGKSSFLKAVLLRHGLGELMQADILEKGTLTTASGLVISYINQDTSFLRGKLSDFCKKRGLEESLLKAILRQLDLDRGQFVKNMEAFSEGQKKKVLIAASLLTSAHLYIWDEPLNYIDVFSRMQIESLINRYKPTMLIVEHDVRFCEEIATRIVKM